MTTLTAPAAPPLAPSLPSFVPPAGQRLLLYNIDWDAYATLGEVLRDQPGLRLTYDRGRLEFMTLSPEHERQTNLLRRLIEALTDELGLPVRNLRSTTYQGADLERGLEPDECFYIANHARMRGVQRIDLQRDPPPDLVLEVDVARSSINRLAIYAALKVPEVWRFDGQALVVYLLQAEGAYQPAERSPTFPFVPPAELVRFVRLGEAEDDNAMTRAYRTWVRAQRPASSAGAPSP